ncbi:MAG: sigma-70 family RNA polymerase sigma factor [Duncaniella sp.]|nr:sigma-70 family RNA polymerase sigma factor [Duncaniella sp.]MDE7145983.1 sigma-70 family RNA polymerase sigma factor [Duncaniella sp.]
MAPPLRERIVTMVRRISAEADADLADDVAQDTLLRLWTMRDRLESYRSVESLAIVIARHRAIDLLRHPLNSFVSMDDSFEQMDSALSAEEKLIVMEERSELDEIISSLPSAQQAILKMKHIEGLEVNEIAGITGSSPGAIRVSLSRTRHHIKELFMQRQ